MQVIQRDRYLNKLIDKMDNGMIKVLTGIRRCGKSFLLFNLFASFLKEKGFADEQLIAIPLDDDAFAPLRDPEKLSAYIRERISSKDKKYFVFIDEAQFAISKEEIKDPAEPIRLYGVLNGLLRLPNVDVYITGSNSRFLSSDIMTEFRGRGDQIPIGPLSFSEFAAAYPGDKYEAWREYAFYGGLPHILAEKTDDARSAYLKRLNEEIYLKDLVDRYSLHGSSGMEEVMKVIASSVGSLSNIKKIADTFASSGIKGVSAPTISAYLKYLQEAFLIEKAERYDIKGRKYISTPAKYYYTDIGLRNALLNFRQFEETHLMENIIFNELIYRGYNVDVGVVEVSAGSDKQGSRRQVEVDFVVNKAGRRYYIQSAYAIPDLEKMQQEQKPLVSIPDSFKKIIVTQSNQKPWFNEQGIEIMSIYDFLLNPDSLEH